MSRVEELRRAFPLFAEGGENAQHADAAQSEGVKSCIYLDNAATTQVPAPVIDAASAHLATHNANVHRSSNPLAARATRAYENARADVAAFIGCEDSTQVVFTSSATEALNLVAEGLAHTLGEGDAVLVTALEHNSNLLPWMRVCHQTGAELRVVPPQADGAVDLVAYRRLLADGRVRVAAFTCASNVSGVLLPYREMAAAAKDEGALVVLDATQIMRGGFQVKEAGCDFVCFSGHKMLATMGIGVLAGAPGALGRLEVVKLGGGMAEDVGADGVEFSPLPHRLEAGTPNVPGAVGLARAASFLDSVGLDWIRSREQCLVRLLEVGLCSIPGVQVVAAGTPKAGSVSFTVDGADCFDVASLLGKQGIAVRSGSHCAHRYLKVLGLSAAVRLSPAFYTTEAEIERALAGVEKALSVLRGAQL